MTTIWSGLTVGAVYSLVAIGYNVVLLASGIFNFAYAQLLMLGVYMAFVFGVTLNLPVYAVVLLAAIAVAAFAFAQQFLTLRPLIQGGKDVQTGLITTVGVAVFIDGLTARIWGVEPLTLNAPGSTTSIHVLGGTILPIDLVLIVVVLAVGLGLDLFSRRTLVGLAALASSENRDAAMLRGINVRRLAATAFLLSGAIAGALALLVGSSTYAVDSLGDNLAVYGFVAIAIGGQGSQIGGLIGGFAVGLAYALVERYSGSPDAPPLIVFGIFVLMLVVRPRGLFGVPEERLV